MLKKLDQAFSKVEGFLSVVLFLAMVAIVCWSVICRYALKIPFLQSEELARYLMIYIVYIGTSIGVKSKSHIGVEVFVDMLPEKIYKKGPDLYGDPMHADVCAAVCAFAADV